MDPSPGLRASFRHSASGNALCSDANIVALVRSPAKAAGLGVQVREADYDRPGTLDSALPGIDTMLLISASEVGRRAAQHRNVIKAAKNAGVTRIV